MMAEIINMRTTFQKSKEFDINLFPNDMPQIYNDIFDTYPIANLFILEHCKTLSKGSRKPSRRLETPCKTQAEVLSAFGHKIDAGGVLRPIES